MASPTEDDAMTPGLRAAVDRLSVVQQGEEYILGRADLGVYVAVPQPGAVLIEALRLGASLETATGQASAAAGEEVDATDFLTGLHQAGLLDDPDHGSSRVATGARMSWVERIPQAVLRPLFGRVAWSVYILATLSVIAILVLRPDLRPLFDEIWFLGDPIISMLALIVISVVITFGHELWHWLAGRALGVTPRFRVSRRGIFIVFESDLSALVTLPRRVRYSPLLAGFAFDIVVLAASLLLRLAYREEFLPIPPGLDRLLGAIVFRQIVVLIWQLSGVAFRSDTYVVLANALSCHNLYRATTLTVKRGVWRLSAAESDELAAIGPRDRAAAGWFWLVYVAGGVFMFWVLFKYLVPFTYGMLAWIVPNIRTLAVDTFVFWESLALVALVLAQFAFLPLIARVERRQERSARPPPVAAADTRTEHSPNGKAWQVLFVVLLLVAAYYAETNIKKYINPVTDATAQNVATDALDDACLPGRKVALLDFPHISQLAAADVVYNSNPPTSGPHFGAALAPGIYGGYLQPGLTVHAMEHGRVVIHYRPDTPPEIVDQLASIARRFARDTVMHPNPNIDAQIALTAWGRIETFDSYDEDAIVRFVDLLRNRYSHESTAATSECGTGS